MEIFVDYSQFDYLNHKINLLGLGKGNIIPITFNEKVSEKSRTIKSVDWLKNKLSEVNSRFGVYRFINFDPLDQAKQEIIDLGYEGEKKIILPIQIPTFDLDKFKYLGGKDIGAAIELIINKQTVPIFNVSAKYIIC